MIILCSKHKKVQKGLSHFEKVQVHIINILFRVWSIIIVSNETENLTGVKKLFKFKAVKSIGKNNKAIYYLFHPLIKLYGFAPFY